MTVLLPLTSIEQYHLADDSPRYPNVIACDLIVSGLADRDIATLALREAARRHLLICARLQQRRWRRPCWKLDPGHAGQLHWQTAGRHVADSSPLDYIDLNRDFPGQFCWRAENGRTRLSFRTHHASMDGGGGMQFVIDWLLNYHRISLGQDEPRPRPVNQELLRRRNALRLLTREFVGKLWIQPIALLGAMKFLFRHVTPVVPDNRGDSELLDKPPAGSRRLSVALDDSQVDRLKRRAHERSVTVNEVVLSAVFQALHELRKRHAWHADQEWLRLVIPVSIRDFADRRLPAANRATIVQLDRTDRDFADPDGLLWGINYELGNIRRWNLEKTFLLALKWMSLMPGWIPRSARRPVCRATSVVTNLGAPLERVRLNSDHQGRLLAGNLVIEDIELTVPIRPRTPAGFAVVRYRGHQKLDLHFDPRQVGPELARELLELTLKHLTPVGEPVRSPD